MRVNYSSSVAYFLITCGPVPKPCSCFGHIGFKAELIYNSVEVDPAKNGPFELF